MTDLRAALIEAGARRLCEADEGDMGMFGDFYRKQATFVIDGVLDTLADRADEWHDLAHSHDNGWGLAESYIAVLRGEVSGDSYSTAGEGGEWSDKT